MAKAKVEMTWMLDGKELHGTTESKFKVQIGKDKSKYENMYVFIGQFHVAVSYYNSVNIGHGYKKRLLLDGKVIARQES